jgi:hypothetical protein
MGGRDVQSSSMAITMVLAVKPQPIRGCYTRPILSLSFRIPRFVLVTALLLLCAASPLRAQADDEDGIQQLAESDTAVLAEATQVIQQPAGPPPTPRHTGIKALVKDLGQDVIHLPSKENLFWTGVGGGLALAVHPADDNVNESLVNSDFAHDFFAPGKYLGSLPVLLGAATATYIVGRTRDQPKVSHVGMDLIEALAMSELITQSLKHATNRERPDGSNDTSFRRGTPPIRSRSRPRSRATWDGNTRCLRTSSRPTSRSHGCLRIDTGSVMPSSAQQSASSPAELSLDTGASFLSP